MKRTGETTRAAVQLCPANRDDISMVQQATYYAKGLIKARFFLVDLPSILGAGFVDHLRRLKEWYRRGDFPFSDIIAPKVEGHNLADQSPAYARTPGFHFNMNCLRDVSKQSPMQDLLLTPGSKTGLQNIQNLTTLDSGQAEALFENLNRRVAFTQGPPGTGKTFLGVAECEVILNSQPPNVHKPIVVACMTNHALDDFVASLVNRNITKIVRLGTRSSCEWMEKYLISNVSRRVKPNDDERRARFETRTQIENLTKLGLEWAEEVSGEVGFRTLQNYLAKNQPEIASQFEYLDRVGVREAEYRLLTRTSAGYAFKYWIQGRDLSSIATLLESTPLTNGRASAQLDIGAHEAVKKVLNDFKEKVATSSSSAQRIWTLDLTGRQALLAEWLLDMNEWGLCEAFAEIHRRHQAARTRLRSAMQKLDARSIQEQRIDIVALTATGCARYWEFLEMLQPRVFLMEEASELTEASTLAALVPSAQQLIKIGDPYQLRPHISLQSLCKEYDDRYRLDESLFERLMEKIPFSRLNTQRRAHPDLADLLRSGDYPYLIDHPSTHCRPEVPGLFSRLYWVHHENNEDVPDPLSPMAKSFSNQFEVEFIAKAVKYLIEKQGFRYNTMTVLTPYNGQVAAFVRALKSFCKVTLTIEDKEALVDAGMLDVDELDTKSAASIELGALLRVTTVDNYQGEENDVVFFSPVRSNLNGKVGFLKNQNRVNVAISRARNGFYVVGNAILLEGLPQWAPVISAFKHKSAISTAIPIQPCSKHSNDDGHGVIKVGHPDKFSLLPSCREPCGHQLPCGHECQEPCHPLEMHEDGRILCTNDCHEVLPCKHLCRKLCYEKCEPCTETEGATTLPCGHVVYPLCGTDKGNLKCAHPEGEKLLNCGHNKTIVCGDKDGELRCDEICNRALDCGHRCLERCQSCLSEGGCQTCTQRCGRTLSCGHICASKCHGNAPCPACFQPCLKGCRHGKCKLSCAVVCDPCMKEGHASLCPHQEGPILCSLPGTTVPCSNKCLRILSCGHHICPGLCGEPCPKACLECKGQKAAEPVYALPCQHIFVVKELDAKLDLDKFYSFDASGSISGVCIKESPSLSSLQCPECGASTKGAPRYAIAHQAHEGHNVIARLCAKGGRRLRQLANCVSNAEDRLFFDVDNLCAKIKDGPLAVQHNQMILNRRLAEVVEIQRDVVRVRDELASPIENALVRFAQFMNNDDLFPSPVLSLRLRCERVHHRCRFLIARFQSMVATKLKRLPILDEYIGLLVEVLSAGYRQLNEDIAHLSALASECQTLNLKRLEVEFLIAKTASVVVARNSGLTTPVLSEDLLHAGTLCATYPNSAGCLRSNLKDANNFVMTAVSSLKLDDAHNSESKRFWDNIGRTDGSDLAYCENRHPFSTMSFPEGCPECGDEREV